MHVDLEGLVTNRWTLAALSTVGVLLSVTSVGLLTWYTFGLIGVHVSLLVCFTFGALISPTDPDCRDGPAQGTSGAASWESQIAGESLFNDGVGVVVFLASHRWRSCPARRLVTGPAGGTMHQSYCRAMLGSWT